MDKIKLKQYTTLIRNTKTNKINLAAKIMQELSYYDLKQLKAQLPTTFHSILALPYLKRKSYKDVFGNGYYITKDATEYVGILLFIFESNKDILNKYIYLKNIYEKKLLTGNYEAALHVLKEINETISYSLWATVHQIKLERLHKGLNSCTNLYNSLYKENQSICSYICYIAYQSASIEYPFETEIDKQYQLISGDDDYTRNFIVSHCFPYKGLKEGEWMSNDFNASIIDLYENFISNLCLFTEQTRLNSNFQYYIKNIDGIINDHILHKYCYLLGVIRDNTILSNEKRDKIICQYYKENYNFVNTLASQYIDENPTDFTIVDLYVKSLIVSNSNEPDFDKDGSLIDRILYHYYNYFKHKESANFHLKRLYTICQSQYNIIGIRHLYNILKGYEEESINTMLNSFWNYSYGLNFRDILFFTSMNEKKKFLEDWGIACKKNFISLLEKDNNNIEFLDLQVNQDAILSSIAIEQIRKRIDGNVEPTFIRNQICSFLFSYYVSNGELQRAILFYVDQKIKDKNLDIRFDEENLKNILSGDKDKELGIPLDLSIFYTLTDSGIYKRFLSYKRYLKDIGLKKASEISIIDSLKIKFFLSSVVDQKVLGLHAVRFHNRDEVIEERLLICNRLYELLKERTYSDEIVALIKTKNIKGLIKQVDESKIYVDEEAIKSNELEEEKILFDIYNNTDKNIKYLENKEVLYLLSILEKMGMVEATILGANKNYEEIDYRYSLFKRLYIGIRDKFLLNPKYGLDYYLSTRIRHGTLVNQLRNHLQEQKLVTNIGESGNYVMDTYWTESILSLSGEQRTLCAEYLLTFTEKVDHIIRSLKDDNIQIKTENTNQGKAACFDFSIENISCEIDAIQANCASSDFEACVNLIFESLWYLTEECLSTIKTTLDNVQDLIQKALNDLERDISEIVGWKNDGLKDFKDSISSCRTELQSDIKMVSRWFQRKNPVDFDFTMQQVLEACITIINNINQGILHVEVENLSTSLFRGYYFNTFNDLFHDLLNNVLDYEKKGRVARGGCKIQIIEHEDVIHIKVSNPVNTEDIPSINRKLEEQKGKYSTMISSGQSRIEGNSGIAKIYNIVANVFRSINNEYSNHIENESFIADIKIDIKEVRLL